MLPSHTLFRLSSKNCTLIFLLYILIVLIILSNERITAVCSNSLTRFISYCISKLSIDDNDKANDNNPENSIYSEDFPKCDDPLLVFSSTILSKTSVKNVVKILNNNDLLKRFIEELTSPDEYPGMFIYDWKMIHFLNL